MTLIDLLAHLAAMEGHLPCLKFIVSVNRDITSVLGARNDQGDTPKALAEQFFKEDCCTYLDALEWEQDHPEQAESKDISILNKIIPNFFLF
jgi:ankyrin repeat domain-containing protein 42